MSAPPTNDGLSSSTLTKDEIVRRGQEAMKRKHCSFEDCLIIAEALEIGRTESMRAAHTNEPTGKRYDKQMGEWLLANGFHLIDKATRSRLREVIEHRAAIEKWRATLTEPERFRFNHPDAVLRRWKKKNAVRDPNAPPSPMRKLKEANIQLQEKLHRVEREIARGGGDLWNADDRPEDIADIMLAKLTISKAERVARAILKKLKEQKKAPPKSERQDATASAEERKALWATETGGGE
jgi:hypothetical protein